jgi:nitrogen fixation-related uncharacterized protein
VEAIGGRIVSSIDLAILATVVGSVVLFGGATVMALGWAFRDGQFDNFQQGALSIFGPDEPVGEMTDVFPDAISQEANDQREADRDGE